MTAGFILVVIVVVLFLLSSYFKKRKDDKIVQKLYDIRKLNNKKVFFEALDSFDVKSRFSAFTIAMMKLNYLLERSDLKEAKDIYDEATALKMKRQDKIALAEKVFELAIKTKDQNLADEALKLLGDNMMTNDKSQKELYSELQDLYGVYFGHDLSLIAKYTNLLKSEKNVIKKGEYCYRLVKLYHYSDNSKKVDEILTESKAIMNSKVWNDKVDSIIKDHSLLT